MSESPTVQEPSLIVGIGASAGGLEAIERFFSKMPSGTGMAFVLVQHLSPDFKSLMDEVLARWTSLPIHRVENGMPLEADAIFLMPPKTTMVVSEGRLLLAEKEPKASLTLPIDIFFRSMARDLGRRSVAVVLSGTGSDGSRGIVDVHEAGGLVIAQSPETAKFDGMPRSAIDTGAVDLVLAPEEAVDALTRYAGNPQITQLSEMLLKAETDKLEETGLRHVFKLMRDGFGLDLDHYKITTIVRRIERRLLLRGIDHVDEYAEVLDTDPEELNRLYEDLLIGVTTFFRDPEAFERLRAEALEPLIATKEDGQDLRVWVAGCATGEEAYSLAILLDEALVSAGRRLNVKVFATDIHKESLEFASHGLYPTERTSALSPDRLETYFVETPGGRQVAPRLRQSIVFAQHNLLKDAPFTRIDLVTCRNVLIYFQPDSQAKVLSLLHFGLRTGGVLFLGPSETLGEVGDEFDTLHTRWKVFQKRRDIRLAADVTLRHSPRVIPHDSSRRDSGLPELPVAAPRRESQALSGYDALLSLLIPSGMLVSADGTLLHTFGDGGSYLRRETGRFNQNALERLEGDLKAPVVNAMNSALKTRSPVAYVGLTVRLGDGRQRTVDLRARPVFDERYQSASVLIELSDVGGDHQVSAASDALLDSGSVSAEQISGLELELRFVKESLQATIEELETSNEELQATNEELVASNEELQSTNEELQSVNEELYTVNAEHQRKIRQLSELSRDMDHLMACTEVHTVFLDELLRIRKFTPGGAEAFNFLPRDIDRRIDAFTPTFECERFVEKVESVIRTGNPVEEEVRRRDGSWFLMRILPYGADNSSTQSGPPGVDGAVLTLVEITKVKRASDALAEALQQRDRFLAMLSHELRNPLATILNGVQVLANSRHAVNAEVEEPLAVITRQSKHMAALLDDLLDVTRVSQGKIRLKRRTFDLTGVIDAALEAVDSRLRSRSQKIVTELNHEGPIWVDGSEARMLQVLVNLLVNASKYSGPQTQIDFSVSVEQSTIGRPEGESESTVRPEAVLRVRDYGVGIVPEQIDKIFDLFVQADRTIDRADGGLGVGLTLVKVLVELHGGTVSVASEGVGKGSEFCVRLPTCAPPVASTPIGVAHPPTDGRQKVLLIEDNADASRMLAFLLEEAGFEVATAGDGLRGLEMITSTQPDAAVIDIGLPGMSGYELAQAIRNNSRLNGIRLIALTGYGQSSDRAEAFSAGFDEHVVKPVDPELLCRLLGGGAGERGLVEEN